MFIHHAAGGKVNVLFCSGRFYLIQTSLRALQNILREIHCRFKDWNLSFCNDSMKFDVQFLSVFLSLSLFSFFSPLCRPLIEKYATGIGIIQCTPQGRYIFTLCVRIQTVCVCVCVFNMSVFNIYVYFTMEFFNLNIPIIIDIYIYIFKIIMYCAILHNFKKLQRHKV